MRWERGSDKLWKFIWVRGQMGLGKGARQAMGTCLGQGEFDEMGKGPRQATGTCLGQGESDETGKGPRQVIGACLGQ